MRNIFLAELQDLYQIRDGALTISALTDVIAEGSPIATVSVREARNGANRKLAGRKLAP